MIKINYIRILIVDGAKIITDEMNKIRDKFAEKFALEIVATIQTEEEIMPALRKYKPHIVLMDVTYLHQKEDYFVKDIVHKLGIGLIVVSGSSVYETAQTVRAITDGAKDYIMRDVLIDEKQSNYILNKLINVARSTRRVASNDVEYINKKKNKINKKISEVQTFDCLREKDSPHTIVAIGTSTGGPKALQKVLSHIPRDFPAAILIVQHMPKGFTRSLANRLNDVCTIKVKEAEHREKLQKGVAYIAPGDYHMEITEQFMISIVKERREEKHRPSVNVLFKSLATLKEVKKIAVILTGMGKDGAEGIIHLKTKDPSTKLFVESKESAVIHGMPQAALNTGYAAEIVHLNELGDELIHQVMKRRK